jgi:hypothetical protein
MMRKLARLIGLPANRCWVDSNSFVDVLSQAGLRYQEGDRTLLVDSELGVGMSMAIWPQSIKWWEQLGDREEITPDERARILTNIIRALEGCGYEVDVLE